MDKLLIRGGRSLQGEVQISGAKNATLPELCAAILTPEPVRLRNVPRLQDVATMRKLLLNMGVQVSEQQGNELRINAGGLHTPEAPYRAPPAGLRHAGGAHADRRGARLVHENIHACRMGSAQRVRLGRWTNY